MNLVFIGTSLFMATTTAYARPKAVTNPTCVTSSCHSTLKKGAFVHGPVKANGCTVCHAEAPSDKKLPAGHRPFGPIDKIAANETCILCHDSLRSKTKNEADLHRPISTKGCVVCHDPHSSQNRRLLKKVPTGDSCLSCHDDLKTNMARNSHPHTGGLDDKSCLNCHDPHRSSVTPLLKAPSDELCLNCHSRPVKTKNGKVLISLKPWSGKTVQRHGATRPDNSSKEAVHCVSCHAPHGNSNRALLRQNYDERFHLSFDEKNLALCLRCHKVENNTEFRNGSKNLHTLHLRRGRKGLSCRACHDPHFSGNPLLIHEAMPYKDQMLPLKFEKTRTGGNCATACHGKFNYDR